MRPASAALPRKTFLQRRGTDTGANALCRRRPRPAGWPWCLREKGVRSLARCRWGEGHSPATMGPWPGQARARPCGHRPGAGQKPQHADRVRSRADAALSHLVPASTALQGRPQCPPSWKLRLGAASCTRVDRGSRQVATVGLSVVLTHPSPPRASIGPKPHSGRGLEHDMAWPLRPAKPRDLSKATWPAAQGGAGTQTSWNDAAPTSTELPPSCVPAISFDLRHFRHPPLCEKPDWQVTLRAHVAFFLLELSPSTAVRQVSAGAGKRAPPGWFSLSDSVSVIQTGPGSS